MEAPCIISLLYLFSVSCYVFNVKITLNKYGNDLHSSVVQEGKGEGKGWAFVFSGPLGTLRMHTSIWNYFIKDFIFHHSLVYKPKLIMHHNRRTLMFREGKNWSYKRTLVQMWHCIKWLMWTNEKVKITNVDFLKVDYYVLVIDSSDWRRHLVLLHLVGLFVKW